MAQQEECYGCYKDFLEDCLIAKDEICESVEDSFKLASFSWNLIGLMEEYHFFFFGLSFVWFIMPTS